MGEISANTMIVVKSKVKGAVKNLNVSGDFADGLNEVLVQKIEQSALRAEANGRKTIGARDL